MKRLLFFFPMLLLAGQVVVENFDSVAVGQVPSGWMASQTNKKSPAIWEVDAKKRLVILHPRGYRDVERNLFFTKNYYFHDGAIAADVMPNPDGGVMFRAHDRKNYYDTRIVGDRVMVERVKSGHVKLLTTFSIPRRKKYRLKVEYEGKKGRIFVDEKFLGQVQLESMQGGVGVCASGESKAVFDNISIEVKR